MIMGVLFENGVPLIGKNDKEQGIEIAGLVRRRLKDIQIFMPGSVYDLGHNANPSVESHVFRAFSNGRGVYERILEGQTLSIKLPDDHVRMQFCRVTPLSTTLLAVIWYADFLNVMIEEHGMVQAWFLGNNN